MGSSRAKDYDFDVGDALGASPRNDWETEFLDGLLEKYEQYGDDMYLSEKQADILKRIAKC